LRRQKAWFLPPASARRYARPGDSFDRKAVRIARCFTHRQDLAMETNLLKRQLKDLGERTSSLRGFL
jgi:hypothetical protein